MNGEGGEFRQRRGQVESLLRALEELPDTAAREAARQLARALFDLHAAGLKRILEMAGDEALKRFLDDPAVNGLLLLHGLHPQPPEVRLSGALERIRHHLRSAGGDVELMSATEERARLRLRGNPESERTLRAMAGEAVIEALPDIALVEFEEAWDSDCDGRRALPVLSMRDN